VSPGRFHEDLGIWIRAEARNAPPRPALFLDRDGVILEEIGYLSRVEDMRLIPGAAELIAQANRAGIPVVEVTNQAGIARGYYGWPGFEAIEAALTAELSAAGAAIDGVFACPYHSEGIAPWAHPAHPARKPAPGMLLAAAELLKLDLSRSWIVGDRLGDLQAGFNTRLPGGLHVLSGHGAVDRPAVLAWKPENFEVILGDSVRDAGALLERLSDL
jgi:D-glycero-D-manno-heptose 1,7-bisphosphate phosphatase